MAVTGSPYATGFTNYGPTGQMQLIVPRWAKNVLRKLYPVTCAPQLCSHNYEGEIKAFGASMSIRQRSTVAIRAHSAGSMLQVTNLPQTAVVTLNIDKATDWAFPFDAMTMQQTDLKQYPAEMVDDALKNTATYIDTDFFTNIYSEADSYNAGLTAGKKSGAINLGAAATPLVASTDNIVQKLVDCGTVLAENDVSNVERTWIVLPPAITGTCLQAPLLQSIYSGRARSPLVEVGDVDNDTTTKALGSFGGFGSVYRSNLLYQGASSEYYCPFGCTDGIEFAAQIGFAESLKNPNAYGDIHRGLNVWGYKVTIPRMVGVLVIKAPTAPTQG